MKKINIVEPYVLCERIELQNKVGSIIIPGQEDKVSAIRKVVQASVQAGHRNIQVGDIVVTRNIQYPMFPEHLTEDDQVPHEADGVTSYELIDPAQIVAIYRDEDEKEEQEEESSEGE